MFLVVNRQVLRGLRIVRGLDLIGPGFPFGEVEHWKQTIGRAGSCGQECAAAWLFLPRRGPMEGRTGRWLVLEPLISGMLREFGGS